jgi:hypothetical protein
MLNNCLAARHQWLTPIILATPEAEIGSSQFKVSLGKEFLRPYLKNPSQK